MKPYTHEPRVCVWCKGEYTPTGGSQRYCVDCRLPAKRAMSVKYYHENNGREKNRAYKRRTRTSPHQEAQYIFNDIIENTAFLDMIRKRVRAQKGDMLSVKKIVRHVLKNMGIESVSYGAKKMCYRATESIITDEFKGVCYGISDYGGIVFKLPKERKI